MQAACLLQALLYLWVAWGMGTALLRGWERWRTVDYGKLAPGA